MTTKALRQGGLPRDQRVATISTSTVATIARYTQIAVRFDWRDFALKPRPQSPQTV